MMRQEQARANIQSLFFFFDGKPGCLHKEDRSENLERYLRFLEKHHNQAFK